MGNLRGWEWVILLLIVLLLFGARKLPDLARSVGKSMMIFKTEVKELKADEASPSAGPAAPSTAWDEGAPSGVPTDPAADDSEPRQP